MKHSILSNLENNEKVKETHEFFKKLRNEEEFEGKIIEDILEPYKHKKMENLYVPPTVKDAQMKENETKNEIHDFSKPASEFNKVDVAATNQKRKDYYDSLFDDITNEGDRKQIIDDRIDTEDIFIDDDYLFDDDDAQETKNLFGYVLDDVDQNDVSLPTRTSTNFFRYSATKKQEQGKASQKNFKKVPKTEAEQGDGKNCREKSPSRTEKDQIYTN